MLLFAWCAKKYASIMKEENAQFEASKPSTGLIKHTLMFLGMLIFVVLYALAMAIKTVIVMPVSLAIKYLRKTDESDDADDTNE